MKIADMTPQEQLKHYTDILDKRVKKENLKIDQEKALKRERELSAFKKAAGLFSLPFKQEAFEALVTALITVLVSILFSGVSPFILIAIVFCAVVDFLYMILFGLFYPFALLYFVCFYKQRINRLEAKIQKSANSLEKMTGKKELEDKIKEIQNSIQLRSTDGKIDDAPTSSVKNTEWYKEKCDEYYRQYMGFPPKDESSLSSLATDTTLDLHPGDY